MIGVALVSLLVGFSGAMIPGSLFAFTLTQALLVGWSAGLWLMIGHMLAEALLVGGLRVGLGGLLQRPAVTRVIGLVGGFVLLYFGWGMLQTGLHFTPITAGHGHAISYAGLIGQGFLFTISNPTWYLWWATAGVGLIAAQTGKHGPRAWGAFFVGHQLADYIWYGFISILMAVSGALLQRFSLIHRGLILACSAAILLIGLLFILTPLRDWLKHRKAQSATTPVTE